MNALEFLKAKENDAAWVAERKTLLDRALQKEALLLKDQQPILLDLRTAGFNYSNLWEMQNSLGPYKDALFILLKHLGQNYMDATRATIARCLAVKDAVEIFDFLVDAYRREPLYVESKPSATKAGIAVAIAAAATFDNTAEIIDLLKRRELGKSRTILLMALRKWAKKDAVKAALQALILDPDLEKEIKSWKVIHI